MYIGISPQTLSSLSSLYKLSDSQTFAILQTILTEKLGAKAVFDLTNFHSLVLEMAYLEFKERFEASAKYQQTALPKKGIKFNKELGLPILSSECPGWVCYAEKTLGSELFPFMSKIKSP